MKVKTDVKAGGGLLGLVVGINLDVDVWFGGCKTPCASSSPYHPC